MQTTEQESVILNLTDIVETRHGDERAWFPQDAESLARMRAITRRQVRRIEPQSEESNTVLWVSALVLVLCTIGIVWILK